MRMRRVSRASECVHGTSGDETRAMLGINVHAMHVKPPALLPEPRSLADDHALATAHARADMHYSDRVL